ncbi:MAG: ion transporter [Thermodesulfobacteriota bacterium]
MKYESVKKEFYKLLNVPEVTGKLGPKIVSAFIMILILLNVISIIVLTVPTISQSLRDFLDAFNAFSVIIFTIEYLLRIWTCTENKSYKNSITGRIRFAFSPLTLIDLIAILPFYLPFIFPIDLRVLRMLRLLRIFKMTRYSSSFQIFGTILKEKKDEIVISLVIVCMLLILSASFMYFAENNAQPDVFSSIPHTMWWAVATISTVGYGDTVPVTTVGKILGGVVALLGISMFALPTGILASGFVEEMQHRKKKTTKCPDCGKILNPE